MIIYYIGALVEKPQMLQFFGLQGRRPIIDRVFSLRDAGAAHQRLERRQQFGKILLRIDG